MKVPAKIEYAVKGIIELALRYETQKPVSLELIAKDQNIPPKFLVQLFLRLKHAGLVDTVRGVTGGYVLSMHPSRLLLADVIRAVDRQFLEFAVPLRKKNESEAGHLFCGIWADIHTMMRGHLEVSLEEFVSRLRNGALCYQI